MFIIDLKKILNFKSKYKNIENINIAINKIIISTINITIEEIYMNNCKINFFQY